MKLRGAVAGALRSLGVVPALTILFVVIGGALVSSLVPLLTAILALVAVTSAAGLLSHVFDTRSVATDLAILIGLGVGIEFRPAHRQPAPRRCDVTTTRGAPDLTSGRFRAATLMDRPRGGSGHARRSPAEEDCRDRRAGAKPLVKAVGHRWRPIRSAEPVTIVGERSCRGCY